MKSKYILAIGCLAALSFSSCGDDFLGKEPLFFYDPLFLGIGWGETHELK